MKVFLTGASGYVGGTVAAKLIAAGHTVQGLVRSPDRAQQVRALGIEPVLGELTNSDQLTELARSADAVVNAAHADDRAAVEALLKGLQGSGKPFVHTSGSGVVADAAGGHATEAIYEDSTPIKPLPARAPRAALNELILSAAQDGVRSVVIAPPMIYGRGLGVNPNSIQIPALIRQARLAGAARYIGAGENRWSNVHVEDLADLYRLALEGAPAGAYYYAENGECSMREIALSISHLLGLDDVPASMTFEEGVATYGEGMATLSFGSNSRVRALRARKELGWSPSRPGLLQDIEHGSYAATVAA